MFQAISLKYKQGLFSFFNHSYSLQFIFFVISFFCATNAFAQLTPDQERAVQQNIQTQQRIEQERQELIRQKEAIEIKNIGEAKKEEEEEAKKPNLLDDKTCKAITELKFIGNSKFSSKKLETKFIKPIWDKNSQNKTPQDKESGFCLTKADIAQIQSKITDYYVDNGFVLGRVYFDTTKINQGRIIVIIEEGKLENLELKDNSKLNDKLPFRRSLQKLFAFPSLVFSKDRVVDIRDVEQGIDQINRLGSQHATVSMESGSKGYSNITVENQIDHLSTISVGTDNSGNQSTGRQKKKVSLNYDNFFGVNDNLYFNYSQSNASPLFGLSDGASEEIGIEDSSNNCFSKSFYASASIPFGYWTVGGNYSYSKYLLTTDGITSALKTSGNSETKSFYVDRVLARGKKHKISFKSELTRSDTDSYQQGTYLPINSRQTSEANFYLNNTIYLKNGSIYLQPKYSKGLTGFGAMKDVPNLSANKPRAQFETYGLYAQSNLNFTIPKTNIPLNHKLSFDSVQSNDSLYDSDQFSLGGKYTVRGFQESIISGDSGYLIRNDLSAKISDLIPGKLTNSKSFNFGGDKFSLNSALNKTSFGIFYDYGYVRNYLIDTRNDEGNMSGAGVALNYFGEVFTLDLTYSKALHSPEFLRKIDQISEDNETIYFSASLSLGLF